MKLTSMFLVVMLLPLAGCNRVTHTDGADIGAIRTLLHQTYDQPGKVLTLEPIVAQGPDAIVDWTQGSMGGRALLQKQNGQWAIVLCAGDALKDAAYLQQVGLGADAASSLAAALIKAERKLPADRLALFALFGAPVRMPMDQSGDAQQPAHHE
jgi:hypothetical protein